MKLVSLDVLPKQYKMQFYVILEVAQSNQTSLGKVVHNDFFACQDQFGFFLKNRTSLIKIINQSYLSETTYFAGLYGIRRFS